MILDNFYMLNALYIKTAAESNWPTITQKSLIKILQRYGFVSERYMKITDIEIAFNASKYE